MPFKNMERTFISKVLVLFGISFFSVVQCQDTMTAIGTAYASFHPCDDGFISMSRESGRSPSKNNYWNGSFWLAKFPNIREARIELQLDSEAVITLDGEVASIYADGNTFRFATYGIPVVPDHLYFEVNAPANKPFPNIKFASLNGQTVCKNPKPWDDPPYITGVIDRAVITNTESPSDFVPYCGRRQVEHTELIVGGYATKHGDWPWHVALYQFTDKKTGQRYVCGGSLISDRAVITAGHCVTLYGQVISEDLLLVVLGKYNLLGRDPGSQERKVAHIVVNSEFDTKSLKGDIAILRLKTRVDFNNYVQPICLWPETETSKDAIFDKLGTVVGWGLDGNDVLSQQLTASGMPVVSDSVCLLSYASFFERFLHDRTFCAGSRNGSNACNGDSGGGLVFPRVQPDNKISYFLRGLVSVSVARIDKAVCDPNHFVVFTDSAKYLDFINQNK